jgi:hypothetical protein
VVRRAFLGVRSHSVYQAKNVEEPTGLAGPEPPDVRA